MQPQLEAAPKNARIDLARTEFGTFAVGELLRSHGGDIVLAVRKKDETALSVEAEVVGLRPGWPKRAYTLGQRIAFSPTVTDGHWVEKSPEYHRNKPFASVVVIREGSRELTNSMALMAHDL